jgi:hypothetical protein
LAQTQTCGIEGQTANLQAKRGNHIAGNVINGNNNQARSANWTGRNLFGMEKN